MSKATILIVEDESIVAADLAGMLGRLGYGISGTTGLGEEAINHARERRPDLVLMDIRLAGAMDGVEAAGVIHRELDLPVIFLTAHSDHATLERAKLTEPFGYLLKPFEELGLETHIEMALYKHSAERKLRQAHDELELRVEERTTELREAEQELRKINVTLERQVSERTSELQAANASLRDSRRAALNMMEDAVIARRQIEGANAVLLLAKEEWENTFNSVPDLIAIIDGQHRITRVNKAMAQFMGVTPEQCIGQSCFFNVHGSEHPPALCPHALTMSDTRTHEAEIHDERLGVDLHVTTTPIFDVFGQIIGTVHVARDITERKRAVDQLNLLAETASQLLISESPHDVIESLCIKAMAVLDCHVFFNYLADDEQGRLHLNAGAGITAEEQRKIEWLDLGATGCICAAHDAFWSMAEDISIACDLRKKLVQTLSIRAHACIPLIAQDRLLGILFFGDLVKNRFSDDELTLMKVVADQIAIAMERMHHAQALQKSHDELEHRVAERTSELADMINTLLMEIDEREKAEDSLEKSLKEIEDLYNLAPCGYHSLDRDGTFVRVNDTELQWLGYDRDEVVGKMKVSDIMTPESLAVFANNFPDFKQGKEISEFRFSYFRKDGSILPVLLNASPIMDENGDYLMSRSTIYDITDLNKAEESVRRLNRLYLTLSETGKAIARLSNRDELLRELCRIAVEYGDFRMVWFGIIDGESGLVKPVAAFGYGTDYLENIRITIRPEPEGMGPTGTVIRHGGHYVCNNFMSDPCTGPWQLEAEKRGFLASASFAVSLNGSTIGAMTMYAAEQEFFDPLIVDLLVQMQEDISFALDTIDREAQRQETERALKIEISERLQAVEALRRQEHILIQQNRQAAMGEMIGNIAHQWRQPLNTLGLFTQRLGFFYGSPSFNKEFIDTSVAKSMEIIQYMSRTIDDFRNFFSAERDKSEFRVNEAVNKALSLIEASFNERSINIEKDQGEDVVIYGFPNEYAQVLLNIFMNAKDAMDERNVKFPRLKITIGAENGVSLVTIADNAGGIPEDIIGKIFDPYFTTKGPQLGTGIGLFMSKTIIENNMGGRLSVRNTDEGAEFRIEV